MSLFGEGRLCECNLAYGWIGAIKPMANIRRLARSGPKRTSKLVGARSLPMIVPVSLRIILETDKEKNARTVLARVRKIVEFELQTLVPYSKGGFEANVGMNSTGDNWPDVVQGVIALAQSLANGWGLGGSIDDEIELVAEEGFRVSGIRFIWIVCTRPNDR